MTNNNKVPACNTCEGNCVHCFFINECEACRKVGGEIPMIEEAEANAFQA